MSSAVNGVSKALSSMEEGHDKKALQECLYKMKDGYGRLDEAIVHLE